MKKKAINWLAYGRLSIFIDVANVIYCLRDLGWRIDYKKLQKYFKTNGQLVDIYFYYSTNKENVGQNNLLEMLARKGFKMIIKEVKIIRQKDGTNLYKGNCDVELTIDMIDNLATYDTAVLFSGDSDFTALIKYLQKHDKKVLAISTRNHIAREIIEASDQFMWFNWFKDDWELK